MAVIAIFAIAATSYAGAPGASVTSNAAVGKTATITVVPDGTAPLTFQWQYAATPSATPTALTGATATTAALVIPNLTTANSGIYTCVITNAFGSITSPSATLTAGSAPTVGGTSISISVN